MLYLIGEVNDMYKTILDKINEFEKVIIIPHIRPDGDCLGSSFGLKYIIEDMGKTAHVVGHHSSDTGWMGEISELSDEDFKGALAISVDTGSVDRMIDKRAELADFFIRIDHHPHVEFFGDIDYVDSEKPSTCTIITDMARDLNISLSTKAAECLFFGTVTDTGRFKHKGVDQNTHLNAGYLLDHGVDITKVYNSVYLKDLSRLELDKFVLNNIQTTDDFIYVKITEENMKEIGITKDDAGNAISKLENIKGFPVWAVFYELDGMIRGRLRSRGPVINGLAQKWRGGGHALASGLTLHSWEELDQFISDLNEIK